MAGLRPDVVSLPYNQGHRAVGRWARGRGVNGLALMGPDSEPLSGLAAFANTRVQVYPAVASWRGPITMPRWAMVIDLDKCVACQGCSIACRQENNTPAVSPERAAEGRAIRWNDVIRCRPE